MNFRRLIIYPAVLSLLLAGTSCTHQKRMVCTPVPLAAFRIPENLTDNREIDFSGYRIRPGQCYSPAIEVRDSFSNLERHMVGISDGQLFSRRPEIVLDLDSVAGNGFSFPLPKARLLSPFGRRHGRMHTGMDLKINRRDTVYASFDGIVRMAGKSRGYGNVIVIRHYNGLETVYAHNSKHLVHSGDHVTAGMPVSITGQTGRATTDHLHFEIRVNGKPVDPRLLIDFQSQRLLHKRMTFSPDAKGKIKAETV